jgi:hypothetical protein
MEATRTLVKSPPELWAELSDVAVLARHLGEFGAIRITRTEPESVVEWEAEHASGSVRLEPSGWGTRVTLTAQPATAERPPPAPPAPAPAETAAPAPEVAVEPPASRGGFLARFFRRRPRRPAVDEVPVEIRPVDEVPVETRPVEEEPAAAEPVEAPPASEAPARPVDGAEILDRALDALGAAHHRPFSR